MPSRLLPILAASAAALSFATPHLGAQDRLGRLFDRSHPAVVQILVAAPDEIREGSGFVVDAGGIVLTYLPLLRDARTIFARPALDDSYYRAPVVATDERRSIAALRIEAPGLPALTIGDAAVLRAGARVAAIGVVAEDGDPVARAVVRGRGAGESYVLDPAAPIAEELTGGPVLNERGEVVAMLVAPEEDDDDALALPLEPARAMLAAARSVGGARERREGRIAGAETASRRPPVTEEDATPGERPDVSGEWLVTNTIERSPYAPFEGLRLGFRLTLRQEDGRVTGAGEKIYENGRRLAPAARSPIHLEGTLDGNTLTAAFRERGARRTIQGAFSWFVGDDGDELGGRFADTSARTSGTSRGERLE